MLAQRNSAAEDELTSVHVERRRRLRSGEEGLDGEAGRCEGPDGRPLLLKHVQADLARLYS